MGELDKVAMDNLFGYPDSLWNRECNDESKNYGWVLFESDGVIDIESSDGSSLQDPVDFCIQSAIDGDLLSRRALSYIMESIESYSMSSNCLSNDGFDLASKLYYGFTDTNVESNTAHIGL